MPKTLGPSMTPHNSSSTSGDNASLSSSLAMHNGIARIRPICTRSKVRVGPSIGTPNYNNGAGVAFFRATFVVPVESGAGALARVGPPVRHPSQGLGAGETENTNPKTRNNQVRFGGGLPRSEE